MQWDAFISHASEDKATVAQPLASILGRRGLRIWLDASELRLGDSLSRKIDEGLARSGYGIVILSKAFFSKHWPQKELAGLVQREVSGEKVILPVWHGVDHGFIVAFSPSLADRLSVSTSDGLEHVADAICEVLFHAHAVPSSAAGAPSTPRPAPDGEPQSSGSSRGSQLIPSAWRELGILALSFAATAIPMQWTTLEGAVASAIAPCFFGFILGLAVFRRLLPALATAIIASVDFTGARWIAVYIWSGTGAWGSYIALALAGMAGALGISMALLVWTRRLWLILPTAAVAGAIASVGFMIERSGRVPWPFVIWQVTVGCSIFLVSRLSPLSSRFAPLSLRWISGVAGAALFFSIPALYVPIRNVILGAAVFAQKRTLFSGETASVRLASGPDGPVAEWSRSSSTVRLWDKNTGKLLGQLDGHSKEGVNQAVFSRTGTYLATADYSGIARLWDLKTNQLKHTLGADTAKDQDYAEVAFSPDSTVLFTNAGGPLRAWDVENGMLLAKVSPDEGQVQLRLRPSFNVSPNGRLLSVTLRSAVPLLVDAKNFKIIQTSVQETVITGVFSPDSRRIAYGHNEESLSSVTIWRVRESHLSDEEPLQLDAKGPVGAVRWSPNGKLIAAQDSGTVGIWDARSGSKELDLPCSGTFWDDFSFSPDGALLVCKDGSKLKIWHTETGRLLQSIDSYVAMAFAGNGTLVVAIDDSVALWQRERFADDLN